MSTGSGPLHYATVEPKLDAKHKKLLAAIAREGLAFLDEEGGKSLADAIAVQLAVLEESLDLDLERPERDYYPRSCRDEDIDGGGWVGL